MSKADFGALGPQGQQAKGHKTRIEDTNLAGVRRLRVESQTVLDRYKLRGHITKRQYDAGQKLARMWHSAGKTQRLIGAYSDHSIGRPEISDRQAEISAEINKILTFVGSRLSTCLISVVLHDEPARTWTDRHGISAKASISVLCIALDTLADYWRIPDKI